MAAPPTDTIRQMLKLSGSDLAESRLREFILDVREGGSPDPETLKWLADAFDEILDGTDPKRALSLSKKKGRKASGLKVAVHVASQGGPDWERGKRGARERAIVKTADTLYLDKRKVEAHYQKHKVEAHGLLDAIRQHNEMEARLASDSRLRAETLSARIRNAILFPDRPGGMYHKVYTKKS
jgi:transcriptional regulator with XRE-family HTH domain